MIEVGLHFSAFLSQPFSLKIGQVWKEQVVAEGLEDSGLWCLDCSFRQKEDAHWGK